MDCRDDAAGLGVWHISTDALLASLVLCIGLTELNPSCGFKSAHWSALLAKLTLRKLSILRGTLETLQCFAVGPIAQSLEELSIEHVTLAQYEIPCLYALRCLRTLSCCFTSPLDDSTLADLTPPTAFLPSLTKLSHQ